MAKGLRSWTQSGMEIFSVYKSTEFQETYWYSYEYERPQEDEEENSKAKWN